MKIIHCADIHLDSPLTRFVSEEKRKERKAELLLAFIKMIEYAAANSVEAVIIAGDLFDQSKINNTTCNTVLAAIRENSCIDFYYLKGNHDNGNAFAKTEDLPKNLHMFRDEWTYYNLGENICLAGVELSPSNASGISASLNLDLSMFNIVALHGQESVAASKDRTVVINLKEYKNKNIDYMALGHIHTFKREKLDERALYCYPGCLESRGFDECGEHGFVLLDINGPERSYTGIPVSLPIRSSRLVSVDVSDLMSSAEIIRRCEEVLDELAYPAGDIVKLELKGTVDINCEIEPVLISSCFAGKYYDFKLENNTKRKVDFEAFKLDESLKGEFIKLVEAAADLSDEDKAEIISIGIKAMVERVVE